MVLYEWARNNAAKRSPVPVNGIPLPITGIEMVYFVRCVAEMSNQCFS